MNHKPGFVIKAKGFYVNAICLGWLLPAISVQSTRGIGRAALAAYLTLLLMRLAVPRLTA